MWWEGVSEGGIEPFPTDDKKELGCPERKKKGLNVITEKKTNFTHFFFLGGGDVIIDSP